MRTGVSAYFCAALLVHYSERWCNGTVAEFPVSGIVSRLLFLFSSRCEVHRTNLQTLLTRTDSGASQEYLETWPHRTQSVGLHLIDLLEDILENAVHNWEAIGFMEQPHDVVVQELVDTIVSEQYVIFHHHETTSRDRNHWGI